MNKLSIRFLSNFVMKINEGSKTLTIRRAQRMCPYKIGDEVDLVCKGKGVFATKILTDVRILETSDISEDEWKKLSLQEGLNSKAELIDIMKKIYGAVPLRIWILGWGFPVDAPEEPVKGYYQTWSDGASTRTT